jgi:hypothetical protein
MAGPQDIQRYPRGLIDLLGMRATGDTPHTLDQSVTGSLELLELYINDRMIPNASVAPGNLAAIGNVQIPGLTVPDRELWLIMELTVYIPAIAAATACKFNGGILRARGSGNVYSCLTDTVSVAANEQGYVGQKFERPVIALPGNVIALQCTQITGAPAQSPGASIWYCPIGI